MLEGKIVLFLYQACRTQIVEVQIAKAGVHKHACKQFLECAHQPPAKRTFSPGHFHSLILPQTFSGMNEVMKVKLAVDRSAPLLLHVFQLSDPTVHVSSL